MLFIPRQAAGAPAEPRAVVTREDDQRAVVEPQILERIKHAADAPVELGHDVAVKVGAALLVEGLRTGQGLVRHRVSQIEEERPVAVGCSMNCVGTVGVPFREGRLHERILDNLFAIEQADRPHVVAVENAEVFVEPAAGRQ